MRQVKRPVMAFLAVMFFFGCITTSVMAVQFSIIAYNYATQGVETSAVIIKCRETVLRGTTNIHLTYQYDVNRKQYTGTTISAFEKYRSCNELPSSHQIDIIYLENEPFNSTTSSLSTFPIGSKIAIMLAFMAVTSGIASVQFAHSAMTH